MNKKIGIALEPRIRSHRQSYEIEDRIFKNIKGKNYLSYLIPFTLDDKFISEYCNFLDAIIICGKGDLCPVIYGKDPKYQIEAYNLDRDFFNMKLIEKMATLNKPILGLERGAFALNAFYGGEMIESIKSECKEAISHIIEDITSESYHFIDIKSYSFSKKIGEKRTFVRSEHRGGISKLGRNLKPLIYSQDGLVEAFEDEKKKALGIVFDLGLIQENSFEGKILDYFLGEYL